jgi:subtilisin family serine protease
VVLNFAGTTQGDLAPPALAAVHADLIEGHDDLLVLSPAGNEGMELTTWPGSFAAVVSVGGLTDGAPLPDVEDPSRYQSGAGVVRASWSNHGDTVDVYAPGDLLVNAYAAGSYTPTWDGQLDAPAIYFTGMSVWSGTSFSTPLVAGMVAARKSASPQSSVRAAWDELAELAARQPAPDAGPALYPGQALD